jgi:hypothetical protein
MSKVCIIDQVDHDIMYEAEQLSYTPEVRAIWTKEYFLQQRTSLPSIGFVIDGQCIGGVYMDHGFIHISILPAYHGKWSVVYARGLEWALSHADPIYAGIMEVNHKCVYFARHSGWEQVGRYNRVVYYRSTRRLYERLQKRRAEKK